MASCLREKRRNQIIYISIGSVFAVLVLFLILFFTFKNVGKSNDDILKLGEGNNLEEASKSIGNSVLEEQNSEEIAKNDFVKVQVNENLENSEQMAELNNDDVVEISMNEEDNGQVLGVTNENINEINNQVSEVNSSIENSQVEEIIPDPVFTMPVEGEIIKKYGKDKLIYSETLKEWTTHLGIDIKADKTTIVKSSSEGCVKSIKNDPRYGLTIVIEHQNGFSTVYSNLLTSEFVTVGENVKSGQTIGTVGNSSTFEILDGPHLHFEIVKDGNYIDPEMYLK